MLKKLSTLLFLCALYMWAADFWTAKPFTEWNEKEVAKMLSDSPWTAKFSMSVSGPSVPTLGKGGGGGGRGGGRGASGPQGDSVGADPGVDGESAGGFSGPSSVSVTAFWQTAAPIRQALIKRQYGAEAGTSPEAKAKLDRVEQVYVLTMLGMPGFTLGSAQGPNKAALLDATTISVPGKPPVKAVDVQVSGGRGTGNMSFLFPKNTPFTADDKEMQFTSKFDKTGVKAKFKLKEMVFNGKLEM